MKPLLDLVFPPICVACGMKSKFRYLCEACWKDSALLDSHGRCRHCFFEIEEGRICHRCAQKPLFPFIRAAVFDRRAPIRTTLREEMVKAMAGFLYCQWTKLDWAEPDLIVPIPPRGAPVTRLFAELLGKPSPQLFRRIPWPKYRWEIKGHLLDEKTTLLLVDEGCTMRQLQMVSRELSTTFPKKVYCISLFL